MKVRIQGNSIRFRLKQPELLKLSEALCIDETIAFGPASDSSLTFSLQVSAEDHFSVSFLSNNIRFSVPSKIAGDWINSDTVGFENLVDTGEGKHVKLLVEKDFRCMQVCADENAGAFEKPFH